MNLSQGWKYGTVEWDENVKRDKTVELWHGWIHATVE